MIQRGLFATNEQAISSIITLIYITIIFMYLFININSHIFIAIIFTQLIIEFSFLRYALKIYGYKMLIFSIFAIQIINVGIMIGSLKFILKKIFRSV